MDTLERVRGLWNDLLQHASRPLLGHRHIDFLHLHPDQLIARITQALARPLVHVDEAPVRGDEEYGVVGMLHQLAKPGLAFLELLLGALAIGHIDQKGARAGDPAVLIELRRRREHDIDHFAVLLHHLIFDIARGAAHAQTRDRDLERVTAGVLCKKIHRRSANHLIARVTHDAQPMIVDAHQPPVVVDRMHHHRRVVVERPVTLLAVAQLFLDPRMLGFHTLQRFQLGAKTLQLVQQVLFSSHGATGRS